MDSKSRLKQILFKTNKSLKTVIFEKKMSHGGGGGGGRKSAKKCHKLFEWPLTGKHDSQHISVTTFGPSPIFVALNFWLEEKFGT